MRIVAALALAIRRLARRPVRSFLLLQGTVWGVAVAILPSAVIQGTRQAALERGASLGVDRIAIAPDPTEPEVVPLVWEDLASIERALETEHCPLTAAGCVRIATMFEMASDEADRPAVLLEASPGAPLARGLALAAGRWLRADDGPDVCVVEAGVGPWLGRGALSPDDEIVLPGRDAPLRVVGVAQPLSEALRKTNDLGVDTTHPLFARLARPLLVSLGIPFVQDAWKRADRAVYVRPGEPTVDWILLRVPPEDVRRAARIATAALVEEGRAPLTFRPLLLPLMLGNEIDRFAALQVAMFLACLGMGAVVMLNLGLLTVLRRGSEIAILRVEGATRVDIGIQFLFEGLVLTAVGCVLGCVLGMGLAALRVSLQPATGFTWVFPVDHALVAVCVALVIGVGASALPALRATRQEPVENLAGE